MYHAGNSLLNLGDDYVSYMTLLVDLVMTMCHTYNSLVDLGNDCMYHIWNSLTDLGNDCVYHMGNSLTDLILTVCII